MLLNIDFDHIHKTNWYRQGGAGRPGYLYIPFSTAMKVWGRKNTILTQRGCLHHGYFNKDAEYRIAMQYVRRQLKSKKYIDGIIKKWFDRERDLNRFIKSINFSNLSGLPNSVLLKLYKKFTQLDFKTWEISIHIEVFDPWADKIADDFLSQHKISLSAEERSVLLSPDKLTFSQEEESELRKISILPANLQEKAIISHQKKYFWMNSDWANVIVLDVDYFRERLKKVYKPKDHLETKKRPNLPKDAESLFYFFRQMSYWRDKRKKAALISNNYYYAFFQEFARRACVSYDAISFAAPTEIIASKLKFTPVFKKHLEARTKKCVYYCDKQEHNEVVLIGKEYDEFVKALDSAFAGQFKELRGTPASRGIARGTVKIINTPDDFKKMKHGDILLAPMTRPEYLPLMKMASAIVTDEGGVTCHAAIVSRELSIPCVIGTQVATEILKDGDRVEVDADKGIVKKIN